MQDQAQGLRTLAGRAVPVSPSSPIPTHPTTLRMPGTVAAPAAMAAARVIAVTSGKGGVGKTQICSNLAVALAETGRRVVLLDADLGLANVHIALGINPKRTIEDVTEGTYRLPEILTDSGCGFSLLAGGSGITELASLSDESRDRLVGGLAELDTAADFVLIDTGAGIGPNVRAFLEAAREVLLITTPEPTSIADAYATLKTISRDNPSARVRVVVNMAASEKDALAAAERLRLVAQRFLHIGFEYAGFIPADPSVPRAVRAQRPVMVHSPSCAASAALGRVSRLLDPPAALGRAIPGYRARDGMAGLLRRIAGRAGSQAVVSGPAAR